MLRMNAKTFLLPFVCLYLLQFSMKVEAQVDRSVKWYTRSSENFEMIYNARQEKISVNILKDAERAHNAIKSYFKSFPEKTLLVLNDQIGLANGSATAFPYPIIRINTALPSYDSSITDYHDWYYELILHEYVHILNLIPANGVFSWGKSIFGSISSPNMLLPRWHTEGLAVALETRESTGGRLRSPFYKSYAEILSREGLWNKYLNSVELNETSTPEYPFGMRPYFFGSLFWHRIIQEKGPESIALFNEENARRIPYLHSGTLSNVLQKNQRQVFSYAYEELSKVFPPDKDWKTISPLFKEEQQEQSAKYSPKWNAWVYLKKTPEKTWQLIEGESETTIDEASAFLGVEWDENKKEIVYSKLERFQEINSFFAVYRYNFETKTKTRIPESETIQFPNPHGEGNILGVKSRNGKDAIVLYHPDKEKWQRLYRAPFGFRISFPIYLNDSEILFLLKDKAGSQQIYSLNLKEKSKKPLLGFLKDVRYLRKQGDKIGFISSHTGRTAIYEMDLKERNYKRIADTNTYLVDFEYFKNENLLVSRLGSKGFKISEVKKQNLGNRERQQEELFYPKATTVEAEEIKILKNQEEYSSTNRLFPHYWFPWIYSSGDGTNFQINTGGSDPLLTHQYSLSTGYNTLTQKGNSSLVYMNNSFPGIISLTVANSYLYFETANAGSDLKIYSLGYTKSLDSWKKDWAYSLSLFRNEVEAATDEVRPSLDFNMGYNSLQAAMGRQIGSPGGHSYRFGLSQHFRTKNTEAFQVFHWKNLYASSKGLPKFHSWNLGFQWDQRSGNDTDIYAAYLTAGGYTGGQQYRQFHKNQGYPRSQFLAYSMATVNFEYKMPVSYIYKGFTEAPAFTKRLVANFVADVSMMDGNYYSDASDSFVRDEWKENYLTVGAELVLENTIGYLLPVDVVLGVYQGTNSKADGDTRFALLFNIPNF